MIRVLIVDDSATMRSLIATVLRADPEIEVAGEASDPLEARTAIKALNPDVITLDIEMPNMNGIAFLEKIMRLRPTPVVMVSTLTVRGAEATLEALALGAVDCVAKPASGGHGDFQELAAKVKAAAKANVRPLREPGETRPLTQERPADDRVIAIGASTGGVEALSAILARFPEDCPPTVIAQHMPAAFTRSFAQRLDRHCAARVVEAYDDAPLEAGTIYIAPGGERHLEVRGIGKLRCVLSGAAPVNGHRPSVDVLFRSVAQFAGPRAVGAILTGMGRDGAQGLLAMRKAGARTLGQDEATCVVYGMPKVAADVGAVERQAPLDRMASELLKAPSPTAIETV
jgi:two-component system chemotaxis response regulator CheB